MRFSADLANDSIFLIFRHLSSSRNHAGDPVFIQPVNTTPILGKNVK
jgi:hypothetical protein